MSHNPIIFDRELVRRRRDRATRHFAASDFLLRELSARMGDRLADFARDFPLALNLGAHTGLLAEYLPQGRVGTLVQSDMSPAMIAPAAGWRVVADEEFLPFATNSFDLVMSVWSLHWVNDLPGALIQIQRSLKPGGLFLAMLPGGETLKELRQALEQAELGLSGGLSPRLSPYIDVRDAGSLLQRAGFAMPVTDSELLAVAYNDPLQLLHDLRGMGEGNALLARARTGMRRSLLAAALGEYRRQFSDAQGRVAASFEIVTLAAWKPEFSSSSGSRKGGSRDPRTIYHVAEDDDAK